MQNIIKGEPISPNTVTENVHLGQPIDTEQRRMNNHSRLLKTIGLCSAGCAIATCIGISSLEPEKDPMQVLAIPAGMVAGLALGHLAEGRGLSTGLAALFSAPETDVVKSSLLGATAGFTARLLAQAAESSFINDPRGL